MAKEKLILGIETSCDDTSICILKGEPGESKKIPEVLAHTRFSQEILLKKWGGVVPEIAARNHVAKLPPLLEETFEIAKLEPKDIDLIGVTAFPGLLGPLLTGLNAAKTLALIHKKPIIPVNHLFAHLEAIFLTETIEYPYLGLLVSGGHSIYFLVKAHDDFEILGNTIDDAAGEAFDKGGKLLGLGYPAGKIIDDLSYEGDESKYKFPIGLQASKDATLSFSGVKTFLRHFLEKNPDMACTIDDNYEQDVKDVCASYQRAIIDALELKLRYAKQKAPKNIPVVVGGGVACNSKLRDVLKEKHGNVHFVKPSFCTDNGAMIANYALRSFKQQIPFPDCLELDAKSRYIEKVDMKGKMN